MSEIIEIIIKIETHYEIENYRSKFNQMYDPRYSNNDFLE